VIRHQLRHQFLIQWLILGIALVTLGSVVVFDLYEERVRSERLEGDRLQAQARLINANVTGNLAAINKVLAGLRDEVAPKVFDPSLNKQLKTLTEVMPGVRTILYLDRAGIVRAASRPELVGTDFQQRTYFQLPLQHAEAETLYISPPFKTALGVFAINVVRTMHDSSGKFSGIVAATLDPDYFRTLLASVLYTSDMWVGIAHDGGLQFMMEPDRDDQAGKNLAQPGSFFTRHQESGKDENILTGRVYSTGEERIMALRTIRSPDLKIEGALVVAVGRDLATVFAAWNRDVRSEISLFTLLALFTCGSLYFYQRRQHQFDRENERIETERQESARFIRAVTDNIPCMVGYWTNELRCGFANGGYLEWFGKTNAEMRGIRIQDLLGDELFRKNEPYIRAALGGKRQQFERTLTKADGGIGHTWASYVPDMDGDRVRGFFVLITDITALKQAENELHLQSEITANAAEGIALINASDSSIRYVNHRFEMLFGYGPGELVGKPISIINSPTEKSPEERAAEINQHLEKEGVWCGEILSRKKDGTTILTYANVSTFQHPELGTLWISHQSDLTERKAVADALHEKESQYRVAIETAVDGFWMTDMQGQLQQVNDAYVRLSGYTHDELLKLRIADIEAQERPEETAAHIAKIISEGSGRFKSLHRRKDGSIWPVSITTTFSPVGGGRFFVFITDLTERMEMEQELRKLVIYHEGIREEERKRIAREVHDELGQLLTALKMNTSLLQMQFDEIPGLFEATERMLSLIESTIGVVRHVASNLRPPALDAGLVGALDWLAEDFTRHSKVQCSFSCKLADQIFEDTLATTMFRIAQEALTNVARHAAAQNASIFLAVADEMLVMEVRDDGGGFDPVQVARARNSFGLLGMGERVSALNGKLTIDSYPGKGTCIAIQLPLSGAST